MDAKTLDVSLRLVEQLKNRSAHLLHQFQAAKSAGMKRLELDVDGFIEALAEPIDTMAGFLQDNLRKEQADTKG